MHDHRARFGCGHIAFLGELIRDWEIYIVLEKNAKSEGCLGLIRIVSDKFFSQHMAPCFWVWDSRSGVGGVGSGGCGVWVDWLTRGGGGCGNTSLGVL